MPSNILSPHILTANDLVEGHVLYLADDNKWSDDINHSLLVHNNEDLNLLMAKGIKALGDCIIVDPHTVPVERIGQKIIPKHMKERIRANGPTTHPQFGKNSTVNAIADSFHSF